MEFLSGLEVAIDETSICVVDDQGGVHLRCPCCGSTRLSKLGEDITKTLEVIPRQWKVIQTVRERFYALIEAHVLAVERLHGDDTTVPILAKGKTDKGRVWVYARDDTPFGGAAPPAALLYESRTRAGAYPERHLAAFTGILQADAYGGYYKLYVLRGQRCG